MGNIGFVALRDLGLIFRDELNITTFIETGTYKGQTSLWAADNFECVVTIEGDGNRYGKTKPVFKDKPNVEPIYGDSRTALQPIVSKLRKPALIWLDAHWCGNYDKSVGTMGECPIEDELKTLAKYKTRHIILIDDARLFVNPPPMPHDPDQWPTLDKIKGLLPDDYSVSIWNDAIIAVPQEVKHVIDRFVRPSELDIVVLTSNNYVHCLPAFAYLFNKFWDAGQPVNVVRYDVRPAKLSGNFTNFAVGKQSDYTWSSGLLRYLDYHNGDLILLMLEDYFIDKPVEKTIIEQLWVKMETHPAIAKIDLTNDRQKVAYTDYDTYMIKSTDDAPFQTSLQAAIWRKGFLQQYLDASENPWQFEKKGTKRVVADRKAGRFVGHVLGCKNPPLSYINAKGGEGNHPYLWDFKKFPEWMKRELGEKGLI